MTFRIGLRGKIVGLIGGALAGLSLMLLAADVWLSHRTLGVALARRALAQGHTAAFDLAEEVAAADRQRLAVVLAQRVAAGDGLAYAIIRDASGHTLAEARLEELRGVTLPAPGPRRRPTGAATCGPARCGSPTPPWRSGGLRPRSAAPRERGWARSRSASAWRRPGSPWAR